MGTSASSSGPGGGVPLVPPWVPEASEPEKIIKQEPTPEQPQLAPSARFGGARRHFGEFSRGGDGVFLRRGIAEYVGKGLGGSRKAAKRMGGAAVRSGALYDVLHSLSSNTLDPAQLGFDSRELAGRSAREIIDRVARFVSPSDGTQDAESSQRAVNEALSDLLNQDEIVDVTSLTKQQIEWVLERHIGYEIIHRIELDIGKAILDNAPSPSIAIDRLDEMRGYIQETVAASFRSYSQAGQTINRAEAAKLTSSVMIDTFAVFEEYVK